ncbi:MAG: hypothetical protein P1U63_01130 [Coxiellaceae bacterium]|nr:hypothetical protein [Coxiellaceae bacterium]
MTNYIKNTAKKTIGSFMFLRAATEPTWTGSFNAVAMDSLMLAGSLALMKLNPFNKNMMKDSELDMYWKSAITMVLGMGAGMLLYQAAKSSINCCTSNNQTDDNMYVVLGDDNSDKTPHKSPV